MNDTKDPIHLAIDLGASGGRVLAGKILDDGVQLEELHRFPNGGVQLGERLVWNLLGQWEQICEGLSLASVRYGERIRSLGADTWGVDYVLLDRNDDQVGPAFHYRDARTRGIFDSAFQRMTRQEIFAETGLQFMEINTAYQLLAMRLEDSPLLDVAEKFLMIPDFIHWQLCGEKVNEYTNASTTQLLNPESEEWSRLVLEAFELPQSIFSSPLQPGESLGGLRESVRRATGLGSQVDVIIPATHDTGSAVLAVPADSFAEERPDWCYISCGTWSLMGVEVARPVLNEGCQKFNFTNEGGVRGSVRLLKNIAGLWILQQCREHWRREGQEWSWEELLQQAESAPPLATVIDSDHPSFLAPEDMPLAIRTYCSQTGQSVPESEGAIVRCTLESLALRYRMVLEYLEEILGHRLSTVHMVGGGVQNRMLCQFAANACNRPVVAGPVEATALGNILMQAIGCGRLDSIQHARQLVRAGSDIVTYQPHSSDAWQNACEKLKLLTSG